MAIVLDCSYAMSLVLPGERPPQSSAEVLDEDLIAPHLFPLEVANAALKSIRRKRYPIEDARDMCEAIERLNISVLAAPDVGPGYHLRVAQAHGLTAYDAVYLDLALNRRCGIATCDAQLAEAARKAGVPVYL